MRKALVCWLAGELVLGCALVRGADPRAVVSPESTGMSSKVLDQIDEVVNNAIRRGQLPGAVVLIVHKDQVVFRRAYGNRSLKPKVTPMTPDTVFDLASLTKPVATAPSIMILREQGKLRLKDKVAKYWPAFGQNGKEDITIEQLLLHTSGLEADNPVADYEDGREKALERIAALRPLNRPGTRFRYSDVNFIVLGELVERLGGADGKRIGLDQFARQHIFEPLGMKETTFRPGEKLRRRAAPTERVGNHWLVGEVHDPRARLLGGVAGHAGLFSTADDLAVFVRMLLHQGAWQGKRVLSPDSVRTMLEPRRVPRGLRALGWDMRTAFSSNRGELFKGFGHTGFTGTSLWIDPDSDTAVIFLSNRVHPSGKGNINALRGRVATLAAMALGLKKPDRPAPLPRTAGGPPAEAAGGPPAVRKEFSTGLDVLVRENFRRLRGRKVGLVTNHTGRDRDGRSVIDLLYRAKGVKLVALFSPEHGLRGAEDRPVADGKDPETGLPVYSLYGKRRKPTAETLQGIDTLVFDIQDAGCRFYTYSTTLGYTLEAAREHKLRVVVLDRPNPINGLAVEGPIRDAGRESFVAYHPLPVRHGLTMGEMARLFNAERKINADLEVVPMEGWRRGDYYDRTGLLWINPSPNLRSLTEALLYPGVGLLETTNVSVGRGTDRPFEWVGAPWIDGRRLAAALAAQGLPGVRFVPMNQTPSASVHKGKKCGGVQLIVDDWARFRSVATGLALAEQLHRLYPREWQSSRYLVLLGNRATLDGLRRGLSWRELEKSWQADLEKFRALRRPYLLYPE